MTSPEVYSDPSWFADSGATNHCTADSENLQQRMPYTGAEQVHIGNGAGLQISSIGKTHFTSNTHAFLL